MITHQAWYRLERVSNWHPGQLCTNRSNASSTYWPAIFKRQATVCAREKSPCCSALWQSLNLAVRIRDTSITPPPAPACGVVSPTFEILLDSPRRLFLLQKKWMVMSEWLKSSSEWSIILRQIKVCWCFIQRFLCSELWYLLIRVLLVRTGYLFTCFYCLCMNLLPLHDRRMWTLMYSHTPPAVGFRKRT